MTKKIIIKTQTVDYPIIRNQTTIDLIELVQAIRLFRNRERIDTLNFTGSDEEQQKQLEQWFKKDIYKVSDILYDMLTWQIIRGKET